MMAVPNLLHVVEQTKKDFPQAWKDAHTGNQDTEVFIEILAARCHALDPKFGLNGKRGNPDDLSDDALNYKGEGADFDPTNGNMPSTVIDVIGKAGSPDAFPQWAIVTNPAAPVGAAWVQPQGAPPPEPPDPPTPPVQPYPDEVTWWEAVFDAEVAKRYASKGQTFPNPRSARWSNRTAYDIRGGMTKEASMAKHLKELDQELGL